MTISARKCISLATLLCTAALTSQAQLVRWAVNPGVYKSIQRCWPGLFLVTTNDGIGVVDGDGNTVVEPAATRITGFHEGKALVLKTEGTGERILGILDTNGKYAKVEKKYYTIADQELFSEGLLTVTNGSGKTAFMNANGMIEKEYGEANLSPFSEGFATVGAGQSFRIVDRHFNTVEIGNLGYIGARIDGGTNVYNNAAILLDSYNDVFVEYNIRTRQGTKLKGSRERQIRDAFDNYDSWDYLGCLTCVSHRPSAIPYATMPVEETTCKATLQSTGYGYTRGDTVVLPPQFDSAEDFLGHNAIAIMEGKTGLLKWLPGNTQCRVDGDPQEIAYTKGEPENITHRFTLTLPTAISADDVSINVTSPDGAERTVRRNGVTYEFTDRGRTGTHTFPVAVSSGNLTLWEGTLSYRYTTREAPPAATAATARLTVKLTMANTQANQNDQCIVTANISNPTSHSITTTVTLTGSELLQTTSKQITIPAKETVRVSTYFRVRGKAAGGQWVKAVTSDGSSHSLSGLQLIPL